MQETTKIAVAGGTGRVGAHVVDVLRERGHEAVPIARSTGVDVITGDGLDDAVAGAQVIIDAATGPSPVEAEATAFFTTAAENLQAAGERAGVERLVVVSIIGTDRFSSGYNAAKQAHERAALAGPIPVHILRAAQFHEFVGQMLDWGRQGDGLAYVPVMRTQLVAARAVAEALADAATAADFAPGSIGEVAGPREERLVDAARLLVAKRGEALRIEAGENPSDPEAALLASGALLPGPGAILAGPTFAEWLDA
jgi:uncharacterized protein YbjT (DUF2867 family)